MNRNFSSQIKIISSTILAKWPKREKMPKRNTKITKNIRKYLRYTLFGTIAPLIPEYVFQITKKTSQKAIKGHKKTSKTDQNII